MLYSSTLFDKQIVIMLTSLVLKFYFVRFYCIVRSKILCVCYIQYVFYQYSSVVTVVTPFSTTVVVFIVFPFLVSVLTVVVFLLVHPTAPAGRFVLIGWLTTFG